MPYHLIMKLLFTNIYNKKIDKLLAKQERSAAEDEIASDPLAWPVIKGTGGIRKARAKRNNVGKSGGIRIIYYFLSDEETIFLLTAYAKGEQEDLSAADKKVLSKLVQALKEEEDE
ncbi:MAG: RelE-like Cytotoxic translational repressor of toxin-antitoxin stability system [Rickettsiaceae bacterium]|jgi:mRNA-degrading endonuclease RelE of RelBE toxin-antitoxin system|nr:RelE-like Cytotoxic translational repressor of toxin-antitoxin stability system [Rickettsiaceae bacterium]